MWLGNRFVKGKEFYFYKQKELPESEKNRILICDHPHIV